MSVDHPIHSRPTAELLAAGVTTDQVAGLHEMSAVMFGDPDRVFDVLGTPDSRGDAATMLGAIHSYRSKSKPMPGRQKEYFEKLRAALEAEPKPPPPMERECRDCGHVQPLSEFEGPTGRKCKTCKDEERTVEVAVERKAPATEEEEKPMATTTTDTKTCTRCGEDKPIDDFYKGQGKCKPCFKEHEKKRKAKRKNKTSGSASPKRSRTTTGKGDADDSASVPEPPPLAASPPLSDANGWDTFTDPRLSDLRAFQEILESTVTAVDSVGLEEAAEALNLIGERFRRKGNDDG